MKALLILILLVGGAIMLAPVIGTIYIVGQTTLSPNMGDGENDYLFDAKKWNEHWDRLAK